MTPNSNRLHIALFEGETVVNLPYQCFDGTDVALVSDTWEQRLICAQSNGNCGVGPCLYRHSGI
ncbi:hypothetical protein [Bacteroides nordii]|uniref:hypothetical protein n=1 Tax=Bacteroides nordii TaxID=291645 RepID=UPI003999F894